MKIIKIQVDGKIAHSTDEIIVCGNSDYFIQFVFSEEWNKTETKTARFIFNNSFVDVVFQGDTVNVPIITNTTMCEVGVFAGDLQTTTPALLSCKKSILCENGLPAEPLPDVYAQIIELVNKSTIPASNADDYGKMLYVDKNGNYTFLKLGNGLKIANGVLMLSGTVTPETDDKTNAVLGAATVGRMILGKGA